jgi:hypothetical protein
MRLPIQATSRSMARQPTGNQYEQGWHSIQQGRWLSNADSF